MMITKIIHTIQSIYYTVVLYIYVLFSLLTPGTIIWNLFKNRKGKVHLLNRDLICDSETLMNLPKCGKPLDGFTNALCPFVPTFLLDNDLIWKKRREVFAYGNNLINERLNENILDAKLKSRQGNVLWDVFEIVSKISFRLVFNRNPTKEEFNDFYSGLVDINKIIKRFTSKPNLKVRQSFYDRILLLIKENETDFLFHNCRSFSDLNELHQVSSVAEDFLTTISVQCTDLICHMLLLYSTYSSDFHENIENSLNETLRLYPLTDLWTRESYGNQSSWICSLVQLNRNGWTQPDEFCPQRWNAEQHPPLMSWGFDIRRCPAQKFATNLSKTLFLNLIKHEGFWIEAAKNFHHERTFPYGCQVSIGYGIKPDHVRSWEFEGQFRMKIRRWSCEKLRMIDQNELN